VSNGGVLVFGAPERASAGSNLALLQELASCVVDSRGTIGVAQAPNNKQDKNKYGFIFPSKSQ
jgi:hypothetical protein